MSMIYGLLGLATFIFWIWMLIDAVKNCPSANSKKLIWVLVIIFTYAIGAILYFFIQRPKNSPTA